MSNSYKIIKFSFAILIILISIFIMNNVSIATPNRLNTTYSPIEFDDGKYIYNVALWVDGCYKYLELEGSVIFLYLNSKVTSFQIQIINKENLSLIDALPSINGIYTDEDGIITVVSFYGLTDKISMEYLKDEMVGIRILLKTENKEYDISLRLNNTVISFHLTNNYYDLNTKSKLRIINLLETEYLAPPWDQGSGEGDFAYNLNNGDMLAESEVPGGGYK